MNKERILLVDDEEALRQVLTLSIEDLGYEVISAESGENALTIIERADPAIVLTDIKMPGIDGVELLRRLKGLYPDVEVIMISGHGDMDLAIQSLQHGATDFLTKPIRDELLQKALSRTLEKIVMRRQLREHTRNLEQIVKEKSARLVELERQIAVGQVVEGLSSAMKSLVETFEDGPSYFNEMPCFISIHNRFLEVVAVNQLFRERLGDMVGRNSWEVYANRQGSGNACPVWMTLNLGKGQRSRETLVDKEGTDIPVIVHTAPIASKDGSVELVIEISVDITEVQRLQEDLRATRERYQRLFDAVPCYISVVDRDFNVIECNRRIRQDFGDCRSGKCHESLHRREDICEPCPILDTFADGESHEHETVVTTRDGKPRNVLVQTAPIRNQSGEIEQVMEISTDITQIRALQDHLSSLGLMLGSMSHGVKGLITSLDGGIYKVEAGRARGDQSRIDQGWAIVKDKVERIKKMVLDILYYAKSREPALELVDLNDFADNMAATIRPKAEQKGVTFVLNVPPSLGMIEMDEIAMASALINFLENAVDACAEDKTKSGHEILFSVRSEPDNVVFEIRDNGMGMDRETKEKMFTLFFSSKGSKGTGLGLFISNQVIEQHGGRIVVESELGMGTTFSVFVPRDRP
ncbi:putative PAS/PAC sensor protein [Alkalidesulfovibrio alkalitolerans DSM 16529]|uniref:histidine kinase n=1 Tax=Alkalidesulfovibrio alkalitolerans DSM 16529 TaxID=1121439 RepID=S7UET4_9BACT|nr:response regulator [Alkalidesulfovibrio alkalitolerans]EPR30738.1 putative PAS/PAC sensor protein [Alkalidesulfovibrio alkalitolerans DSM 16529]